MMHQNLRLKCTGLEFAKHCGGERIFRNRKVHWRRKIGFSGAFNTLTVNVALLCLLPPNSMYETVTYDSYNESGIHRYVNTIGGCCTNDSHFYINLFSSDYYMKISRIGCPKEIASLKINLITVAETAVAFESFVTPPFSIW